MFADEAHANLFCKKFDGGRMHASERDKPRKLGRKETPADILQKFKEKPINLEALFTGATPLRK